MIDTITLVLKETQFEITNHNLFSPSTIGLYGSANGYYKLGARSNMVCKQNPTTAELRNGIYKPRLSITKRMSADKKFEILLKIEVSIPKLYFGNNLDELTNESFYEAIAVLKNTLDNMGVNIEYFDLIKANVSGVHYGKNIPLTDYTTPYTYIKQLTKLNINRRLDTNQTDYRNEGHSFKYRANTFEICFYDKLKDYEQSKISPKRSMEKDTLLQSGLFDRPMFKQPFEVLRMEVRLSAKPKLRSVLKKLKINVETDFNNLFDEKISQTILLHYVDEIESKFSPILRLEYKTPEQFFTEFLVNNPDKSLAYALKHLGNRVIQAAVGTREFRQMIGVKHSSAWHTLNKETKLIKGNKTVNPFEAIRNAIEEFKPLKLDEYRLLNE